MQADFDIPRAHRYFAIELNNLAWDLIDASERSSDDVERMIHAAHASCHHWLQAGTPINHLRAQYLLATAYLKAGLGEAGLRHARRALQIAESASAEATAFDRATLHGCIAAALAANHLLDQARSHDTLKAAAAADLDPEEKELIARLYPNFP